MVLCVIPARGGSKGLKDKNLRLLNGKPLIRYAIDAAKECEFINKIVVTTDSKKIASLCKDVTHIMRSKKLSGDRVPLAPVINDALVRTEVTDGFMYNDVISLQANSPFCDSFHIKSAFARYFNKRCDSLLSVKAEFHSIWKLHRSCIEPVREITSNRQWIDPIYVANGALFITERYVLLEKEERMGASPEVYVMRERDSLDIHTIEDLEMAEWLIKKKQTT